jgi:PAS domain S-box-containing protein
MEEDLYFSLIDDHLASERPIGLILISPSKKVESVNTAAEALLGVPLSEAVGRQCSELLAGDLCSSACPFDSVLRTGQTVTRRIQTTLRNRPEVTTVRLSLAPLIAASGERTGVVEVIQEEHRSTHIMDRLDSVTAECTEERMKLTAITDSISQGIFAVDRDFRITFLNKAGQEIIGYTEQEVVGKSCQEVFQSDLCGKGCPMERTLAENNPVRDVELFMRDRGGEKVPVRVNTTILRDTEGRFLGAVETFQDLRELRRLTQALERQCRFENIVGRHNRMGEIFEAIQTAAENDVRVLIHGESGTGKELIARAIHHNSDRRDYPFVKVVCGAMPESLLESELFGHVKGAFTGAHRDKRGRLELAQGGTVFLDEVADISLFAQVKLLRFLQEHEFEAVGGTTTKKVDVRVIAATNKDLEASVAAGHFREDLYYRLNVFAITIPPLRERKDDIPLLVSHILEQLNSRRPKGIQDLSPATLNHLMNYDWPGNVRELENAIEHAFVCTKGSIIMPHVLPPFLRQGPSPAEEPASRSISLRFSSQERDLIVSNIEGSNWNLTEAAKRLGISRTTLWRKMRKYNIAQRQ